MDVLFSEIHSVTFTVEKNINSLGFFCLQDITALYLEDNNCELTAWFKRLIFGKLAKMPSTMKAFRPHVLALQWKFLKYSSISIIFWWWTIVSALKVQLMPVLGERAWFDQQITMSYALLSNVRMHDLTFQGALESK